MWEVLGGKEGGEPGKTVTGWDISGWEGREKEEEERKKVEEKARRAEDMFRQLMGDTRLDDESTKEQISGIADRLRAAMTETLDRHAVQKRWCSRSKRWWTDELRDLRKTLGRVRRRKDWEATRVAKRDQRREIRRAKRTCWNEFLQGAKGNKVWVATRYTADRLDKTGQAIRD